MCNRIYCICQMTEAEATDAFMEVWDAAYTSSEEAYIDTEPDIAGPIRELDRRQREEKNRRRRGL
jgi:hypothetical protein